MRRVVYATRADEIRQQRDEYDAATAELEGKYEEQSAAWMDAYDAEKHALEKEVIEAIGPSSIEDIEVRAEGSYYDRYEQSHWEVYIKVNDRKKFDDKTALSWHYDIKIDKDGNIKKETGSWSGLQATTPEQLADLKESVRLIEKIGQIDWPSLLNRVAIKYDEYVDTDNYRELNSRKKDRPKFEDDIIAAELSELIGKPVWIHLSGSPSSNYGYAGRKYWAKITRETPANYEITIMPEYYSEHIGKDDANSFYFGPLNVRKVNFLKNIFRPIETIEE